MSNPYRHLTADLTASSEPIAEGADLADILAAMDENLWRFWSDYGAASGAEISATPELRWFATGLPLAVFNGVPFVRLSEDGVEPALAEVQASVDRRGAPAMWWVGPQSRPTDLALRLERHGLALTRVMTGMVVALDALPTGHGTPADFHIARVRGGDMQRLWARTLAEGSGFPDGAGAVLERLEPSLPDTAGSANPRYVGFLSDRAVATSVLVPAAGLAGVYAVATVADARRRGIGAAMTALPLLDARKLGYRIGMLQATVMGHSVYRALGFRAVCEYRCYAQVPSQDGR